MMDLLSMKETAQCDDALHQCINVEENPFGDIMRCILERQHEQFESASNQRRFLEVGGDEMMKNETKMKVSTAAASRHHTEKNVMSNTAENDDDIAVVVDCVEIGDWLQKCNNVFDEIMTRISNEANVGDDGPNNNELSNLRPGDSHCLSHNLDNVRIIYVQPHQPQKHRRRRFSRLISGNFRAMWKILSVKMKKSPTVETIECIEIGEWLQKRNNVFDEIVTRICNAANMSSSSSSSMTANNAAAWHKDSSTKTKSRNDGATNNRAEGPSSPSLPRLMRQKSKLQRFGSKLGMLVKKMLSRVNCKSCDISDRVNQ